MSTIGYGDIYPSTPQAKLVAIIYLPLAVIALADAITDVQMIGTRRAIRETDFGQTADECLLRDAVRDVAQGAPANVEPVLTEAEFLIDQLLANELVDEAAVVAIKRQFAHLTRRAHRAAAYRPVPVLPAVSPHVPVSPPICLGVRGGGTCTLVHVYVHAHVCVSPLSSLSPPTVLPLSLSLSLSLSPSHPPP